MKNETIYLDLNVHRSPEQLAELAKRIAALHQENENLKAKKKQSLASIKEEFSGLSNTYSKLLDQIRCKDKTRVKCTVDEKGKITRCDTKEEVSDPSAQPVMNLKRPRKKKEKKK